MCHMYLFALILNFKLMDLDNCYKGQGINSFHCLIKLLTVVMSIYECLTGDQCNDRSHRQSSTSSFNLINGQVSKNISWLFRAVKYLMHIVFQKKKKSSFFKNYQDLTTDWNKGVFPNLGWRASAPVCVPTCRSHTYKHAGISMHMGVHTQTHTQQGQWSGKSHSRLPRNFTMPYQLLFLLPLPNFPILILRNKNLPISLANS